MKTFLSNFHPLVSGYNIYYPYFNCNTNFYHSIRIAIIPLRHSPSFAMDLHPIDESTSLDSFADVDNGTRRLGRSSHNRRAFIEDDVTLYTGYTSTNATTANMIGAGRTLGKFYGKAGKPLAEMLGNIAHKYGFGPDAVYDKIRTLYSQNWRTDNKKGGMFESQDLLRCITHYAFLYVHLAASKLQNLCFKLFEHTKWVFFTKLCRSRQCSDLQQCYVELDPNEGYKPVGRHPPRSL